MNEGARVKPGTPMTTIQRNTLDFIAKFINDHGFPPSIRDIQLGFGVGSTNCISDRIVALEKRGLVERRPMLSRGLVLTELGKALTGRAGTTWRPAFRPEPPRPEPTIVRTSPVVTGQCPDDAVPPSEGDNE